MQREALLRVGAQQLSIHFSDEQMKQLLRYVDLLQEWNQRMNLTAITDTQEIITKHLLDSLSVTSVQAFSETTRVIDIGTGAGLPGIPLAILYPQVQFTLLDAVRKKITFLEEVKTQLSLQNVHAIHGRAEDYARQLEHREQYDLALSRAVALLPTLVEYALPFVRVGGFFIAYKGETVFQEIEQATPAIALFGGTLDAVHAVRTPTDKLHYLVAIRKISTTPEKYPRKAGKPSKQALLSAARE
ncbi:MAG: 16S rRNA (guanine(527)-N(7))-methyltransferase RsmG [Candidatus Kerfeldbacteria bacterium]|nr:16S rRNA (guanine(527)-N(7))-methyltransferase RsmG [Candidatus Kerfeldbacteria bacterium]